MKTIKVCIGSACHIKGSYDVIEVFKELINEHGLDNEIELLATFCTGECRSRVSVKRWDGEIISVLKENARVVFEKEIIAYL